MSLFNSKNFSFTCKYIQVNEKFFELKKGHIGIVEKAQETSLRCVLECRETPTSQVSLYPSLFILWIAVTCVYYRCLQFRSLVAITYIAYEGEGRDGYRDQIVTCDVGVSLHSKTHRKLVSCAFSTIPICPFFNSKNFSFTCLHSFFTCLKQIACSLLLLRRPRIEFPNAGTEYNLQNTVY